MGGSEEPHGSKDEPGSSQEHPETSAEEIEAGEEPLGCQRLLILGHVRSSSASQLVSILAWIVGAIQRLQIPYIARAARPQPHQISLAQVIVVPHVGVGLLQ